MTDEGLSRGRFITAARPPQRLACVSGKVEGAASCDEVRSDRRHAALPPPSRRPRRCSQGEALRKSSRSHRMGPEAHGHVVSCMHEPAARSRSAAGEWLRAVQQRAPGSCMASSAGSSASSSRQSTSPTPPAGPACVGGIAWECGRGESPVPRRRFPKITAIIQDAHRRAPRACSSPNPITTEVGTASRAPRPRGGTVQ